MRTGHHLGAVAAAAGRRPWLTPGLGQVPYLVEDFNRADNTNLGGSWVERVGQWTITSNRGRNAETGAKYLENNVVAAGKGFAQAILRATPAGATWPNPALGLRWSGTSTADARGYFVQLVGSTSPQTVRILKLVDAVATVLDSDNATVPDDTDVLVQLYVADGVQQAHALGFSMNSADTAYDGLARALVIRNGGTSGTPVSLVDDVLWFRDKLLLVSGLEAGYKAKVLNAGASVVAQATESAGLASVDLSRFGGCTEEVPVAGWPTLVVTDGSDVELARYEESGIYPGLEAAYSLV